MHSNNNNTTYQPIGTRLFALGAECSRFYTFHIFVCHWWHRRCCILLRTQNVRWHQQEANKAHNIIMHLHQAICFVDIILHKHNSQHICVLYVFVYHVVVVSHAWKSVCAHRNSVIIDFRLMEACTFRRNYRMHTTQHRNIVSHPLYPSASLLYLSSVWMVCWANQSHTSPQHTQRMARAKFKIFCLRWFLPLLMLKSAVHATHQ